MYFSTRRLTQFFVLGALFLLWPWTVGATWTRDVAAAPCDPAVACFDVKLNPATLTGDFYLDGNLVTPGVNSARLIGTPGVAHTVEVRNLQDPSNSGFGNLFIYPDQSRSNQSGSPGQVRFIYFYPTKTYVKGLLDFTCSPRGRRATDNVACRLTLDGVTQLDIGANAKVTYPLPPGVHTLHTELVGDQANNWSPTTRDDTVTISAGRSFAQTARFSATFTLKGLLKIKVQPTGLLADLYVDGALIAAQSASAEVFVAQGKHTVEARAVTDPKANGLYVYSDISQSVSAFPASTRYVYLYPKKNWLFGFLSVNCFLPGKTTSDDVQCLVSSDGAQLGTVAASSRATFNLPNGTHTISVATSGASAGKWPNPLNTTLTIVGGRTSSYFARFSLSSTPSTPPISTTPGINHLGTEKVVLADYFMWWEPSTFTTSLMWDVATPPYNSDDYGAIQRHVAQAQQACLNGFDAHWYGPQDGRTTNNFNQLLNASRGTNLRHAIVVLTNITPGASEQLIIDAIRYAMNTWGNDGNYLRLGGRPVIVFTNMERPWGNDTDALAAWQRIRAATDPNHTAIWMAEGLKTIYNPLFDGLYVYRIDHRDFPSSWLKQKRWADALRGVERSGNLPIGGLYFADTIAPGFDDTRAANAGNDLRSPAPPFARDRRNGGYYADTFAATANTGGDFLFVKSFNEWIEGTEIEPGTSYGDFYLNQTCQYANAYRGR